MRSSASVAALAATLSLAPVGLTATPPAGFEDHTLVDGGSSTGAVAPVGIAYEPGSGALFVLEKGDGNTPSSARVRRRDAATGGVVTALTIGCVDSVGERGLLGIAFDPDYLVGGSANRYVYFYYTRAVTDTGTTCAVAGLSAGGYNQVVRYHESGGQLTDEELLLRGPLLGANNHDGGTVRFAPDKTLYISMGDNATASSSNPASRNMNDLRGKILRINRDGTIPSSNPFVGQAGARPEIWAWGLRNPFRMQFDAATGNLYIADVGEDAWEELDAGIAGADYGWPCNEADVPNRACTPAPTADVKPIYAYDHGQGNCIIGGPVYHSSAFPAEYSGAYFFGDYGGNWIRRGRFASDGRLVDVETFLTDATGVSDIAVSPAGCLTWVSNGREVRETCFVGGANGQPQARASAAPLSGLAPLTVAFDGTASTDPDQDLLSYSWTFGDATSSAEPAPLKTYTTNGVRQAVLTVDDRTGTFNATDSAPPLRIVVGNRSPQGSVTSPAPGAHYNAGDVVTYTGTGNDPEDGALPPAAFSWTIVFHHTDHTHPFLGPIAGAASGSFTIPASGEDSTDVFYRVTLDVADSGAPLGAVGTITHESFVDIVPNVSSVTVAAAPAGAGLQLSIDQSPATAPWSKPTVAGFPRTVTAPSPQSARGSTWTFVSWSDGGAASHAVAPAVAPSTYTAAYQCVAGCDFTPSLTVARFATDTARLQWAPLSCASSYDVIRGNLTTLRGTAGNFSLSTAACVADDTGLTSIDDAKPTSPSGFFFLVRGNGCGGFGTYDEGGVPSQPGSRDAEIAASGVACP